jgi:two-component system sensor histidine kinase/response regulator
LIRAAIQKQNAHSVAATAHSLKGSAGIFGAKEIVEEARNLEMLGRSGTLAGANEVLAALESKTGVFEAVLNKITAEAAKKKTRTRARTANQPGRRR